MNAPKKTPRSARKPAAVPISLTADESAWLLAYRTMNQEQREMLLKFAGNQARKHPMVPPAAAPAPAGIRLVVAGGKRVSA